MHRLWRRVRHQAFDTSRFFNLYGLWRDKRKESYTLHSTNAQVKHYCGKQKRRPTIFKQTVKEKDYE